MRAAASAAGVPLEVDSAGVVAVVGWPPERLAVAAAAEVGLTVEGRARQVTANDIDLFDLVLAMDSWVAGRLQRLAPAGNGDKVRMFRSFDPGADSPEVPDPYGAPLDSYRRVVKMIVPAADGLVSGLASTSGSR